MPLLTAAATSTFLGRGKPANVAQLTDQIRLAVRVGKLGSGQKLPTIRQLSDETGLARNVVSRAFGNLQAEGLILTRKKAGTFIRSGVDVAADELKVRSQIRIFALVVPEVSVGYYNLMQRGFERAAASLGYQIVVSNTDNDVRYQADLLMQLMDKSVAGVALVPATLGPSAEHQVRQLWRNRIPVVLLHRGVQGVCAPQLLIPTENVGRLAAEKLVAAGHHRIAYCASQRAGAALEYERGFRTALDRAQIELPDDRVFYGNMTLTNADHFRAYELEFEQWFDRQLLRSERPTAIFATFEPLGEIVYLTALQRGLRVPEDLSILTISGKERHGAIGRRLTCVTLDEENTGKLTAELLDAMSRGERPLVSEDVFTIKVDFDPAQTLIAPEKNLR